MILSAAKSRRITVPLLISLILFAAHTAYADDIHQRAQCAQVELAIELGDDVDPGERAACAGIRPNKPAALVRPTLSSDKASEGQVPPLLSDLKPESTHEIQTHTTRPGWVDRIPKGGGLLYGVGIGPDLTTGFQRAVLVIAAQLQVSIEGESRIRASSSSEAKYKDGRKVSSEGKETQYLSESTQMMVKGALEDIRIEDQYTESKDKIHVLAALDLKALKEKEEKLLQAVLAILSRASERFVGQMRQNRVIDQESLYELVSVLDEVNSLGRSKIGKKVRKRWRKDYRKFKRLVEKAVQCGDVEGFLHSAKGTKTKLDSQPLVKAGDSIKGVLSCRGLPITRAKIYVTVEGGIADVPELIETDARGAFQVPISSIFGQDRIRISLRHSLRNIGGAYWLGEISKTRNGTIEVRANVRPTMALEISGVDGTTQKRVYEALASLAVRKWGALVKPEGDAQLSATARIDFSNPQETSGHYAQNALLQFTVQSKGRTLVSEDISKGALGDSLSDAKNKSLNNLLQAVGRLR